MLDPSVSLILFDVGNVLIQLRPWREALPVEEAPPGVDVRRCVEELRNSEILVQFELGRAGIEDFCSEVRRVFSSTHTDAEIRRLYLRLLGDPMPGMEKLLRDLKSRGLRLAGFSNTTAVHREALPSYPTVALLERLVTSCELELLKPSVAAFKAALRILEAKPEATVFVDDLLENVEGARAAGLKAILFDGVDPLRHSLGLGATS